MIRLLPLALVVFLSVGCGARGFHIATVSVVSAHATASVVQDTADAFVCGAATAPPAPACVPADVRKAIAGKLSPTFDLTGRVAALVKAIPPDAPIPATVLSLLAQITDLVNSVLALLPSQAQARIVSVTGGAQ